MSSRRYFGVAIALVALGLFLRLRALDSWFQADDLAQLAMLHGDHPATRAPWDLYRFVASGEAPALVRAGVLPWWADADLKIASFRPLPSLLIALDERWFGAAALGHHLHAALWWVAMVLAVAALYRRLLPPAVATLATGLFVLDEAQTPAFGTLDGRAFTLACTGIVLVLLARTRPRGIGLEVIGLALAFSAGEPACAMLGYPLAHALIAAPKARRARALTLPLAFAAAYLAIRTALECGAVGSGLLIDPIDEPARFAGAGAGRLLALLGELVLGIPAVWWHVGSPWTLQWFASGWFDVETWRRLPDWEAYHGVLGLIAAAVGFAVARWGIRGFRTAVRRDLAWLGVGAALSLPPLLGALASGRLLLPASVGVSALLAAVLFRAGSRTVRFLRNPRRRRVVPVAVLWIAVSMHVCDPGIAAIDHALGQWGNTTASRAALERVALEPAVEAVVIVDAVEPITAFSAGFAWHLLGRAAPMPTLLSASRHAHLLDRVDDRTIELQARRGTFLDDTLEYLHRRADAPLLPGTVVAVPGGRIEVVEVRDGRPLRLRLRADRPLEPPATLVLESGIGGLEPFTLPGPGGRALVPHAELPPGTRPWPPLSPRRLKPRRAGPAPPDEDEDDPILR